MATFFSIRHPARPRVAEAANRAFELRGRATEQERLAIEAFYAI